MIAYHVVYCRPCSVLPTVGLDHPREGCSKHPFEVRSVFYAPATRKSHAPLIPDVWGVGLRVDVFRDSCDVFGAMIRDVWT